MSKNEESSADINAILEIVQQFGPERKIPEETRIRSRFPAMSDAEIKKWLSVCEQIEKAAYRIVCETSEEASFEHFSAKLLSAFPVLTEERVSRTINQAMYFAMK
ncbi:hypothetical protein [Paenibacillus eucommiae]|uniref:Uncharacterized protein n=1 Tax=Paenibacillus eucommiae TaxID=1355755 RepID=A0ABS4IR98_9BACL|nr:hypothetical protein [Paenibacillus eucommiae]MBP1990096.1 hypothetical protein [Paenibacillus eucommiae]